MGDKMIRHRATNVHRMRSSFLASEYVTKFETIIIIIIIIMFPNT